MPIKWKLQPPFFREGATSYTFGELKIETDEHGIFETDGMPSLPIEAIAKRVATLRVGDQ